MDQPADNVKEQIRARFLTEGFDAVGFMRPLDILPFSSKLTAFLEAGYHGDMDWLAARETQRRDPNVLWPEVRSVIVCALNYGPEADPLEHLSRPERGVVSVYARGSDYHDIVKKRLKRVGRWMGETYDAALKVFVDTAPVMEKPLAALAGLGWQGKHTNLVSRKLGSWTFLGVVYSALELEPDRPETDHCGTCQNCLDICPTKAFPSPYQLDARRCISYLTIEHKGHIDRELRPLMGNRIYGCDDCLAVCPWNKYAQVTRIAAFEPRLELRAPLLADYVLLDDATFREVFQGSPIKRIGRNRFIRNVLIAIGNSGLTNLAQCVEHLLEDDSPLVRAMAVWACGRLHKPEAFGRLRNKYSGKESDVVVASEWKNASPHP